jgi:hypothetical protein
MNCPKCGGTSNRILDTIRVREGIRRHRICNGKRCRHKFATLERIEEWDPGIQSYVAVAPDQPAPLAPVIRLQQDRPAAAAKTQRHAASLDEDCLVNVCSEAQPLLVEWWNVSRKSKHGAKAAWSEAAWLSSVARVAKLPAWQQVLLARAGVEHGWQTLKPEYMKDELTAPTAQGRPMPKDPAMLAALEQWPSQTA